MDAKPWYQSKTIWFNILTTGLAILSLTEFGAIVPASWAKYIAFIMAAGNVLLRFISDGPVTISAAAARRLNGIMLACVLGGSILASACGDAFIHAAAVADRTLSENALKARLAVDEAHARDCDLQTPGVQPCLSDADYQKARTLFSQTGQAGLAFGAALRASDKQGAYAQAQALIGFVRDLLDNQVIKLPADDRLIAESSLTAIQTAFAALHP